MPPTHERPAEQQIRQELQNLIDHAPQIVKGKPTVEEMDANKKFKVQVKAVLEDLPAGSGMSYKAVMRQVKQKQQEDNKNLNDKKSKQKLVPHPNQNIKRIAISVDYICVLGFEATCNDGPPPKPQEIIEFPTLLFNCQTREIEDTFHQYIKPDVNPQLSPLCTELTGITQGMVDAGISSPEEALKLHQQWLDHHGLVSVGRSIESAEEDDEKKRFLYVTCGDWDLNTCLPDQLAYHGRNVPVEFCSWINIKWAFEKLYHRKAHGMLKMLEEMDMAVEGRHHSGIDDCRSLARICVKMLDHGWVPQATAGVLRVGTKELWRAQNKQEVDSEPDTNYPYKTVFLIRHAQSKGQVARREDRKNDISLRDCDITSLGCEQAMGISSLLSKEEMESIELVISSPLTRALHTSILGFPNHSILVQYDLREVGSQIPENSGRLTEEVLSDLHEAIQKRHSSFSIEYKSLQPKGWPHPRVNKSRRKLIENAFEWMYNEREERTFAVVCHYNVIRFAIFDGGLPVGPENAVPIKCRLLPNGQLVVLC